MNNEIFDRELSWLSFNYRVLQEAKDPTVPLLERIKFLAIFSSNLDEFYRVRVASLRSLLTLKKKKQKKLKISPRQLLTLIQKKVHRQQEEFGSIFRQQIIPQLKENNICLCTGEELDDEQKKFISDYFYSDILPQLQPALIDQDNISLFLKNRSIYLAVQVQKKSSSQHKRTRYAILEIPVDKCGRFIVLPERNGVKHVMFIDDILRSCLHLIFPGFEIVNSFSIKLTRDAELYIDDEFSGDLREKIKKSLSKRTTGVPCRFLYDSAMPGIFLKQLKKAFGLGKEDLFPGGRYHNFHDFFSFPSFGFSNLEYEPMPPLNSPEIDGEKDIFTAIEKKDQLLHYPYHSYKYVIDFLTKAAADPEVTSIKITLYRTAKDSAVIKALIAAAKKGKSVTAFVEIKARFDEELNFQHAEAMEAAGIKVHYSFPGMKVHSKICLVTKMVNNKRKYYTYLATGNFNEKTARVYSDFGFFTADETTALEVKRVFNFLVRKSAHEEFRKLFVAPFNLRESFVQLVDNEIKNAAEGKKAYMILKLNSIEDKKMIRKLYEASCAGVKILMIVRGICGVIPGVKNLSSNIKIISIVDRFLEHSRVYIFGNGGDEKIFLASADWMTRNLKRRVELCFPVTDETIKKELRHIINIQLKDNTKARVINRSQTNPYRKSKSAEVVSAQRDTYVYLKNKNVEQKEPGVKDSDTIKN